MPKVSALPVASALTGTEMIPVVQSGVSKRTTSTSIASIARHPYIDLGRYCSGSGDESTEFDNAVHDAAAAGKWLYHPPDLSVYVNEHVTEMPNGFRYLMDGRLWTDATQGDGGPDPSFAFLENEGWQTAAAGSEGIVIIGSGLFERTADVTGDEGPGDRHVRLRGGNDLRLDITTLGGLGGLLHQGCDNYRFLIRSFNPGDSGVANDQNFGVARCKNGYVKAYVENAGYLLDGVTPTPSLLPQGSSCVMTQHGTRLKARTVNPRYTAFETGNGASDLLLDVQSYVDIDGRNGDIGLAGCSDVTVNAHVELHNGGKGMVHVVSPDSSQSQTNITIDAVGVNDHVANGFEAILVKIGGWSSNVDVKARAMKMAAFWVQGSAISGIDIDYKSVQPPRFGGYASGAGVTNCRIRGRTTKPGTDTTAGVFRSGLVIDQVGAGCKVTDTDALDEGAGTMQHAYYIESCSIGWARNTGVGSTSDTVFKPNSTLTAPVEVS